MVRKSVFLKRVLVLCLMMFAFAVPQTFADGKAEANEEELKRFVVYTFRSFG